ncbi:MAG: YceD family protein [Microcystaceae cyanobacterium]
MQSLYIPHLLQQPQRTQVLHLDCEVPGLETLTPIRGEMKVRHGGTFLEVGVQAETIVTMICDRCAQQYNDRLALSTSELIWLDKDTEEVQPQEREVAWEDLSESLPSDGHFSVETWLYEQFTLALPLRRLCGKDCQPPQVKDLDSENSGDRRWSALEILKQQLS